MSEIIAFTRCHYGADYLDAVIRSTEGFADKHLVLYTETPTFGRDPGMPCPDSRDTLINIAHRAGGRRLEWIEGQLVAPLTALRMYPQADLILELDADEILHPELGQDILTRWQAGELTARDWRLPMLHHWRTFKLVCRDALRPVRLRLPTLPESDERYYPEQGRGYIHHMGYARRMDDMTYKLALTQHADEWREGWLRRKFLRFPQVTTDLHPVCIDMWDAEPFDLDDLPPALQDHPYRDLEVIA